MFNICVQESVALQLQTTFHLVNLIRVNVKLRRIPTEFIIFTITEFVLHITVARPPFPSQFSPSFMDFAINVIFGGWGYDKLAEMYEIVKNFKYLL